MSFGLTTVVNRPRKGTTDADGSTRKVAAITCSSGIELLTGLHSSCPSCSFCQKEKCDFRSIHPANPVHPVIRENAALAAFILPILFILSKGGGILVQYHVNYWLGPSRAKALAGSSVIRPFTPRAIMRRMSASSFTVQVSRPMFRSRSAATKASSTCRKDGL